MLSLKIRSHLKKSFDGYEIPEKYLLIKEDFTVGNKLLAQSLKLKRRFVLDYYAEEIEELYRQD